MAKVVAAFAAVVACLVIGCSKVDVIGKYRMEVDSSAMKDEDKAQAEFASAMLSMVTFEFKPESKCVVTAMGQPIEGTYSIEGGTLTMKLTGDTADNMPKSFKILDGGKRLEPVLTEKEATDMRGMKLYLVRATEEPEKPAK